MRERRGTSTRSSAKTEQRPGSIRPASPRQTECAALLRTRSSDHAVERRRDVPRLVHGDAAICSTMKNKNGDFYRAGVIHRIVREWIESVLNSAPEQQQLGER